MDQKIIQSLRLEDYEIYTEDGWKDLTEVHKTRKFEVWELKLETRTLKCADEHIVVLEDGFQCYVCDLMVGDLVCVDGGVERVESVKSLGYEEHMYDVSVDSDSHLYYVNGILSHNTTVTTIFITHFALFNKHKNIYLIANKQDTALEIMYRIQEAYKKFPMWMQQGVKEWSKSHIELENGTRITAATTAPQSISGQSVGLLYIDELSKVPEHIAEEFMTATLPVISSSKTAKIIASSTPLGTGNVWHRMWVNATNSDSSYHRVRVGWWECYDEEFKRKTIADNGLNYWWQEYECRFLGAKDTLIEPDKLEMIETRQPIDLKHGGLFRIYEKPIKGCRYVVGVDVATGVGGDYSVAQVFKIISHKQLEQVAVYRNNKVGLTEYAQICVGIGDYYNKAMLMVENNLGGGEVADAIWYTYEYENVYNNDPKKIGVRATTRTKMVAVLNMKRYIENGWVSLVDGDTVKELSNYGEKKRGNFGALGSKQNDDLVAGCYWALFYMITDEIVENSQETIKQLNKIDDKYVIEPEESYNDDTPKEFYFSD